MRQQRSAPNPPEDLAMKHGWIQNHLDHLLTEGLGLLVAVIVPIIDALDATQRVTQNALSGMRRGAGADWTS